MKFCSASIIFIFLYRACATSAVKSNDVRNYLGSRTPYRFIYNKNETRINFPNCKETKIWMLIRHGTRLPSYKDIEGMKSTLMNLKTDILTTHQRGNKGELSEKQLHDFERWSIGMEMASPKDLTKEGQEEMVLLAERMIKRFPHAIKNKYHNESFYIRYTASRRTQQSARHFSIGLFDKKNSQLVIYEPVSKIDTLLRFYKYCDKWQKQVKNNPVTYEEQKKFGNSPEMTRVREKISKKLGLSNVSSLDDVNLMYKICGFETSWYKHKVSPWCHAFDVDSAAVMEYYNDLKHYWLDGYAHPLTYQQACLSFKHMLETFSNTTGPSATFLFAHSGTMLKFLAYLGLYKPEVPLTGEAFQRDRPWRTSKIDSFASNLAFVLYKCRNENFVLTLHQEKIIQLPICDDVLCPLSVLQEYYRQSVSECDHSLLCKLDDFSEES